MKSNSGRDAKQSPMIWNANHRAFTDRKTRKIRLLQPQTVLKNCKKSTSARLYGMQRLAMRTDVIAWTSNSWSGYHDEWRTTVVCYVKDFHNYLWFKRFIMSIFFCKNKYEPPSEFGHKCVMLTICGKHWREFFHII